MYCRIGLGGLGVAGRYSSQPVMRAGSVANPSPLKRKGLWRYRLLVPDLAIYLRVSSR